MIILGISAYHGDSAACVVRDGQLIAAIEEERLRRLKHWAGLPTEAIQECLREAGVTWADVDHVAVNRKPNVHLGKRLSYVLRERPSVSLLLNKARNLGKSAGIQQRLEERFGASKAKFHHIEHHQSHLASAYYVSGFDQAAVASVDAMGDFSSAAWGHAEKSEIKIHGRVYSPHSLGIFYSAITQFIGYPYYGDEYKVMGLAPYGNPTFVKELGKVVQSTGDGGYALDLKFFRHHRENFRYTWDDCMPEVGTLFSEELAELLGPARDPKGPLEQKHKDLARSAQVVYEDVFFALLKALEKKSGSRHLALAGGCALNSVANGKIYARTGFRKIYIPAAAGDAGGCIGAALTVYREMLGGTERCEMRHGYWGPSFSETEISDLLGSKGNELKNEACVVSVAPSEETLAEKIAERIAQGSVVGWFQGRMEWGPRALGNRSILCDPRRADMKEILNVKIKRRESFRPFAPSILRERVGEWFETEDDVPFMMQVYQIREPKRPLIPAVTHVDGSGRLQTVHADTNPLYHKLITAFERKTGVPIVLNTSFNENEPVVCHPREALDCFLRTKMDVLVLGRHVITRN